MVLALMTFCSQKVWNGLLTLGQCKASSKQSPTSCLPMARVFFTKTGGLNGVSLVAVARQSQNIK